MRTFLAIALLICAVPTVSAQENPFTTHGKGIYRGVKLIVINAAEKMPEEKYGFKPVDSVRTFGQIVGHIADASYLMCSAAMSEKNAPLKIEQNKTTKAELVAALKDAFAQCDKAYDGLTDAKAAELVKFHGGDNPRLGVLHVTNVHAIEHYGNLIVYLRMNGIVPPTSEPEFMKQLMPAK